jgi:hypothetical protein
MIRLPDALCNSSSRVAAAQKTALQRSFDFALSSNFALSGNWQ